MVKNIFANFLGRFWSILSNFVFIPLYIHYLGFESYSIISFTLVIAGLMAVLDAGLTATLSREFARVDNKHEEKIRVFKTLETSYFFICGLCIISIILLSQTIGDNWLKLKLLNSSRISYFIRIISFDIGFQMLLSFYLGGLLGLEKQVKANFYQICWGIFRNGLVILVLLITPSLEMFFIWQALITITFTILLKLSLNKVLTGRYSFEFQPKIEKSVFKRIWRFAGGMLLIAIVSSLNTQMDKIAISKFLPIESLGYYTLAVSLSMGIIVIVNPISIAILPRFTNLYSAGKSNEASILFSKINLYVSILVFSIMANMSFYAKELIWIWTGNMALAENAYIYLPILAMSSTMLSLAMIPYNIAIANGYTKLNNLLGIYSLLITLPGYWFATKQFGAIGAAYVFCGVQTMVTLIYFYFINKKFITGKSKVDIYVYRMLFPLLLSLIFSFGLTYGLNFIYNSRITFLVWIGLSTIITMIISALLLIGLNDTKKIIYFLKNLKKNKI